MPAGPEAVSAGEATVDPGLEATGPASNFYNTFAKDPTANYLPAGAIRNVGTGVAVQDPGAEEVRGLLPGSIIPMTGSEMQRTLASSQPGSIGAQLASGYQQLFGRNIDPAGAEYFMNRLGGQNLDQAAVNRLLLGGAQGADQAAAQNYQLSLTGGRPDPRGRQYYQPIYQSSPQDYSSPRTTSAPGIFSQGFNPFDYASAPSDARLNQITQSLLPFMTPQQPVSQPNAPVSNYTGYNPFVAGAVNPFAMRASRPVGEGVSVQRPTSPLQNPYLSSYLQAFGQSGGVGS